MNCYIVLGVSSIMKREISATIQTNAKHPAHSTYVFLASRNWITPWFIPVRRNDSNSMSRALGFALWFCSDNHLSSALLLGRSCYYWVCEQVLHASSIPRIHCCCDWVLVRFLREEHRIDTIQYPFKSIIEFQTPNFPTLICVVCLNSDEKATTLYIRNMFNINSSIQFVVEIVKVGYGSR